VTNAQQQPHANFQPKVSAAEMAMILGGGINYFSKSLGVWLWKTKCPAHDGNAKTLQMFDDPKTGKIKFYCLEGCHHDQVRAFAFERVAQVCVELQERIDQKSTSNTVISIARPDRIRRSLLGIKKNTIDLFKTCAEYVAWRASEIFGVTHE
jgi:hypothetical protein